MPASPHPRFFILLKGFLGEQPQFTEKETQLERGQDTDQEAGARDSEALLIEVGTAEEQEHVGLVLFPVFSKNFRELPQLCQIGGEPQRPRVWEIRWRRGFQRKFEVCLLCRVKFVNRSSGHHT